MVHSPARSRLAGGQQRHPLRFPDSDSHVSTHRARRRAVTLLVLTILLPGSAQFVVGNRPVGRVVLRAWLVALGLGALLAVAALFDVSVVVQVVSNPVMLTMVEWGLYIWAVLWALLLVDAWRLGLPGSQPPRTRRRVAIATVLLMMVPATTAYAATSVSAGRSALAEVFTSGPAMATSEGRYNILLLGGDSGAGRDGTRPDSLQLVSVHAKTGRAVTFGFARDTSNIHFRDGSLMAELMPEGWTCGDECLLNGLYTWGWEHKDQFPSDVADPGLLATREAVEALSGLEIQYYILVDLNGFRNVVDALGGLDITVMRRTPIGGGTSSITGYIEAGEQHLDGYHALWYARSRAGSSNYERMARQRCVLSAMVDQVDPRTLAMRFPEIASASKGVMRTDIPQSELGTLAELAMKTRSQKVTGVNFVPPLIKPWDYDSSEIHRTVKETIKKSDGLKTTARSTAGTSPADPGGSDDPSSDPVVESSADQRPGVPATYDPLAHPSEDAYAEAEDIASVCRVG